MSNKSQTTKEFRIPVTITRRNQIPVPESTKFLFWDQPSGEAKATGTLITNRKDRMIKEKTTSWKANSINKRLIKREEPRPT